VVLILCRFGATPRLRHAYSDEQMAVATWMLCSARSSAGSADKVWSTENCQALGLDLVTAGAALAKRAVFDPPQCRFNFVQQASMMIDPFEKVFAAGRHNT
jgi:hypothetical protein